MTPYIPICPPIPAKPRDWSLELSFSPAFVQRKLNGVRALLSPDGKVFKKSVEPVDSLQDHYGRPGCWLDGELWHPDMDLQTIAGLVNRRELDDDVTKLQFWSFDLIHDTLPQRQRFIEMEDLQYRTNARWKFLPPQYTECPLDALELFHLWCKDTSCDGMIYRRPDALYPFGKTADILKRKRELDGEYLCTGVTEGMGKFFGMLGSFQLVTADGVEFSCGGGDLTVEDRRAFWKHPPVGQKLQVRYPYLSADGKPQCAQFIRVRNDLAV